jgi:hypothetical protein
MSEKKKKNLSVGIQRLEQFGGIHFHGFKAGETYPLAKLMAQMEFLHGIHRSKPQGDEK